MTKNQNKQKISFKATKIVSKSAKVNFYTRDGRHVYFRAHKNMPESVRLEFYAKRKNKK